MGNVTYKHLEGKTVIGLFSLGQWLQLLAGAVAGLVFGLYLSPLPATPTIFVACLLPGLPLAASYGAMGLEFSLIQGARSAWRLWRRPRHYLPGPGQTTTGYTVEPDPDLHQAPLSSGGVERVSAREFRDLWDA